ncbi:MAG TPA: oligosaccharide flippase family protein [Candidatus Dormibacteraeota bacterium]|nr:oligosaccharide flippase family protein [Candidatus Dormibacteraeota bacterium]
MSRAAPGPRAALGLGAAQVAGQVIGLGMMLALAHRLGLAGFGEYAVVSAIVFVANVGTSFGTDMVLVREIAASGSVRRVAAATTVQLGLSLLAIAVLWTLSPLVAAGHSEESTALRVLALSLLPAALFSVCTAVLRGVTMLRTYALVGVASSALPALAVLVFVADRAGVVRTAVVLLLAQVAFAAAVWLLCATRVREFPMLPHGAIAEARAMLHDSARIGVLGLLGMAYQRLPVVALGIGSGSAAASWFTCASRTVEASKTGHVGIFSAVYPALAEAHADGAGTTRRRDLRWSWPLTAGLGAAVTVALLLLAPEIVERLFGPAFAPSSAGLRILALSVVPSTLATYRSLELLAAHRETATLRVLGAGLAVLVVALAALVPTTGWVGAPWAVLIAESAQAAIFLATPVGARHQPSARSRTLSQAVSGG